MIQEFKAFISRGNVIDLAVGVIIGAAFGKIVTSVVNDLLMPVIGLLTGRVDFSQLFLSLDGKAYPTLKAAQDAGAATLNYGAFVSAVIQFLIVAWAVFLLVKAVNAFRRKEEEQPAAAPEPSAEEKLLGEIRDLLKNKQS